MLQLVNRTDKATSPRPTRDKSHSLNGPRRKKPASEMTFLALATQGAKPEVRIEPGWPSSIPTVERYANNQKPETEIFPAQRFEIVQSRRNGDRHLPSLLTPACVAAPVTDFISFEGESYRGALMPLAYRQGVVLGLYSRGRHEADYLRDHGSRQGHETTVRRQ